MKSDLQTVRQYQITKIIIEKRGKQFRQSKTVATNTKIFYRELGKKRIEVNRLPTAEVTEQLWKLILEDESTIMKKLNG